MKRIVLLAATTLLIAQAHADSTTVTILGSVYSTTCHVDNSSTNMTVEMGQVLTSAFKNVGDTGEWKTFDMKLTECPSSLVQATATFTGQADSLHPSEFANTGTAQGLALELANPQGSVTLAPQSSFSTPINSSDHTADFALAARYYCTSTPVSGGTFSSTVQVTFTYQ